VELQSPEILTKPNVELRWSMFTGLIEALGSVVSIKETDAVRDLTVTAPAITSDLPMGASVAVNGVCLTVVAVTGDSFRVQAGPETLRLTNLGELSAGDRVNLERALRLGDRLGGHLVQGHVDGRGWIERRQKAQTQEQSAWEMMWFRCPAVLTRQMVPKGSIAVDGVSLTLVDVQAESFSIALIPHTLAVTTLGCKRPGDSVNLETDMFAKYVGKYMEQTMPG
jgi:riboflavin synthase